MRYTPFKATVLTVAVAAATPFVSAQNSDNMQRSASSQGVQQMSAEHIKRSIAGELGKSRSLAGTEISVSVTNNTVTLDGTVGSNQDKERAARIAQTTRGVRDVKNNLDVDRKAVEQRRSKNVSDEKLAKTVAQKLADDTFEWADASEDWLFGWEVDGYNWEFDVDVDDGTVTLDGDIGSYSMLYEALTAARQVAGVKSVDTRLYVRNEFYSPYSYYNSYPYGYYHY